MVLKMVVLMVEGWWLEMVVEKVVEVVVEWG